MKNSICRPTKKRIPLGSVPTDPRRTNIFIDSCAFDPKYSPEDISSERLFQLYEAGVINLIISHSNIKELEHPKVPAAVRREANTKIYTINVQLTESELVLKAQILRLLAGNGRPENMRRDAEHVFEAQKYGKFFVTTDKGILTRNRELGQLCGVVVLLPGEMLRLIDGHDEPGRCN